MKFLLLQYNNCHNHLRLCVLGTVHKYDNYMNYRKNTRLKNTHKNSRR